MPRGGSFGTSVARANQRLYQMTNGRFELAMQESAQNNRGKTGLDLDVIDHYTGKRRSVKTLVRAGKPSRRPCPWLWDCPM